MVFPLPEVLAEAQTGGIAGQDRAEKTSREPLLSSAQLCSALCAVPGLDSVIGVFHRDRHGSPGGTPAPGPAPCRSLASQVVARPDADERQLRMAGCRAQPSLSLSIPVTLEHLPCIPHALV